MKQIASFENNYREPQLSFNFLSNNCLIPEFIDIKEWQSFL